MARCAIETPGLERAIALSGLCHVEPAYALRAAWNTQRLLGAIVVSIATKPWRRPGRLAALHRHGAALTRGHPTVGGSACRKTIDLLGAAPLDCPACTGA